jgi:hypothetical protein
VNCKELWDQKGAVHCLALLLLQNSRLLELNHNRSTTAKAMCENSCMYSTGGSVLCMCVPACVCVCVSSEIETGLCHYIHVACLFSFSLSLCH